jgi:hypothetical protein
LLSLRPSPLNLIHSADEEPEIRQNPVMPRLLGMCGLSFSGKTTLAKALASAVDAEYIGLDDINEERGLRGGDGIPGEEWEKTSSIAVQRVGLMLSVGRDVVLDDTSALSRCAPSGPRSITPVVGQTDSQGCECEF